MRHYMMLLALESPVLTGKATEIRPEDLIIFAKVCSQTNPFTALQKPSWSDKWKMTKLEVDSEYFIETVMVTKEYIDACCSAPKTYTKEDGVKEFKKETLPGVLSMATSLMSKLHFTKEDAWSTPVGQAVWLLTAYAIGEGSEVKIMTTQDEASAESEREMLKRMQREALARIKEERGIR